ncbi:hypothetical protein BCY84_10860 [Trypanosoma cruzi cruzi]|nr:hypothetical protein BCY84_10860 [Trypanosoma cruzi cruzi]
MFRVVLGFPKPLPPHQRIMKPPPPQQFGRTARPQTQHGHRGPPTEPCNSHGSAPGEPSHARGLVAALLLRRPLSGAGWGAPPLEHAALAPLMVVFPEAKAPVSSISAP